MKSSVRSSRFIQPRRLESVSQQIHDKSTCDGSDTGEKLNNKSEASPDCVVYSELKENIADILCNLEQMYDNSFLKWDNIRRSDELEHAMMRGIVCLAPVTSTSSQIQQADEKIYSVEGAIKQEVIHANHRCLFISEEAEHESESEQYTCTNEISGIPIVFDVKCFASLALLLLFLLRVSYSQRINM